MNCTLIAAALSKQFESTVPFVGNSTTDLQDYLSSNGVLFTMLMPPPPPPPPFAHKPAEHWSGSWINKETGLRTVGYQTSYYLGVVTNPKSMNLRCVYPTDAASDIRDDGGCGPIRLDPDYGSQGIQHSGAIRRWFFNKSINHDLAKAFPNATERMAASCHDVIFAGNPWGPGLSNATTWKPPSIDSCTAMKATADTKSLVWSTLVKDMVDDMETFTHPEKLCTLRTMMGFDVPNWHEYMGPCSWAPSEWAKCFEMSKALTSLHDSLPWWNEVVASVLPKADEPQAYQAVFYVLVSICRVEPPFCKLASSLDTLFDSCPDSRLPIRRSSDRSLRR